MPVKMQRMHLRAAIDEDQTMPLAFLQAHETILRISLAIDGPVLHPIGISRLRSEDHRNANIGFRRLALIAKVEVVPDIGVRLHPQRLAGPVCILDGTAKPHGTLSIIGRTEMPHS